MYIIVVGAGNLGYYLTQILVSENQDVVVIEKDLNRSTKIMNDLDVVTITGDATEPSVLQKAGIDHADTLICLTDVDETNLVVGLIAKEFKVKTVAASLSKIHYQGNVLKKLGIDVIIHPEAAAAGYIAQLITQPDILDLSFFSKGDAEIIEITISKKSKYINGTIANLNKALPKDSHIIGLYKKDDFMIPKDKTKVEYGDKILVISKKTKIQSVKKIV